MTGLNFKDWEKISSDKSSTTLRHKRGHIMKIAHAALPKIQQEQLKRLKMADGGSVDDVPEPNKENAQAVQNGATQSGWQPEQWGKNLKEGLGLSSNYKGGKIKRQKFDEGTPDAPVEADDKEDQTPNPSPNSSPVAPITINVGGAAPAAPNSSTSMAAPLPPQNNQLTNAPAYSGNPNQIAIPGVQKAPGGDVQGLANMQAMGSAQQQAVNAKEQEENAKLYDTYQQQEQARLNDINQKTQMVMDATHRLDAYTQSHGIDKNAIFRDMSVPAKISSALGILIGGFTAPITGRNPAMEYLMDQQNKDIQAQKDRMDQQKTVYGAYHQLFGDDLLASNAAGITYNNMLQNGLKQTAAKLGTPASIAAYNLNNSLIQQDTYRKIGAIGQRISQLQGGQAPSNGISASMEQQSAGNKQGSINPDIDLLTPNAEEKYKNLGLSHPTWTPEQINKASAEYTAAAKVEPVLQSIPQLYEKLENTITPGGALSRSFTPHLTGAIGETAGPVIGAIASVPGEILSGARSVGTTIRNKIGLGKGDDAEQQETDMNKDAQYKAASERIATDFYNALPPGVVSKALVDQIVSSNSPGYFDDPETRKERLNHMIKELRQAVSTSTAEAAGLVNKRPKP